MQLDDSLLLKTVAEAKVNNFADQAKINDLLDALTKLLARWANEKGVQIDYNTKQRNLVRFRFRTPDNIGVAVKYDFNQTSKEYIDNMVAGVRVHVVKARQARLNSPIIINTGSKGVH